MTVRRLEQDIQRAVVAHYRARTTRATYMFAVPNGGYRRPIEAAIMKATGVTPGIPDLIGIRDGRAFLLELKAEGGRLSDAQRLAHEELRAAGAEVATATGLDEALAWLEARGLLRGRAT
jgi:hypothetical protein